MIRVAKQAGAIGARLTGAGFGGCTVNLVHDRDIPAFLMRVDRYFYRSRLGPTASQSDARLSDFRAILHPQGGAGVIRP